MVLGVVRASATGLPPEVLDCTLLSHPILCSRLWAGLTSASLCAHLESQRPRSQDKVTGAPAGEVTQARAM